VILFSNFLKSHDLSIGGAGWQAFHFKLLAFLIIKQIENDCCKATLGKMLFILQNFFNKQ
jgi:hypothetical protein